MFRFVLVPAVSTAEVLPVLRPAFAVTVPPVTSYVTFTKGIESPLKPALSATSKESVLYDDDPADTSVRRIMEGPWAFSSAVGSMETSLTFRSS